MSRLKTLRVRFALWTAGLILIALILFGIFVYLRTAQYLIDSVDNALILTAAQTMAEGDIEHGKPVPVADLMEDLPNIPLRELGFSLRILDRAGQTFQVYGPYRALPQPPNGFTALDQLGELSTFFDSASGHSVRLYTSPIIDDNELVGTVQVALNLNSMNKTLTQLLSTLLMGSIFIVLVAGAGGYLLAGRALSPIDQITRTARRISIGDLSARLNLPPTDDEVGRLAVTFDMMLARLDDGVRRERQFAADASHELRTPLTTMQTILGSTLARPRTPAEYEQALSDLAEETDRMKLLAEGLLVLARNDFDPNGTLSYPAIHERVDLSLLLQDVTDSLRPLADEKNVMLDCNVPSELIIPGNRDELIRLSLNLLGNAIQYTEQGEVTISLHQKTDDFIEIAFADTGIGIAAENLPYIFDRFYRVEGSRTSSGAGLGLAIALSVAEAHGGSIGVESEVGKGTVFFVRLARRREAAENYDVGFSETFQMG